MILLSLLRDLNITLFKFYPIHWCFFTVWIFKGCSSPVATTPLKWKPAAWDRNTCCPSACISEQLLLYFPVSYSWHRHRINPRDSDITFSLCFPLPSPAPFSFTPCSHLFMPSFPDTPCFQTSLSSACSASAFPLWPPGFTIPCLELPEVLLAVV